MVELTVEKQKNKSEDTAFLRHPHYQGDDQLSDALPPSESLLYPWQSPHAPQFPPQEQEGLPFFFFIISFAITAIKSIAITAVMIIVITVPFVIVGFIFLMQPSDFHPKIRFFDSNKDFCERPYSKRMQL